MPLSPRMQYPWLPSKNYVDPDSMLGLDPRLMPKTPAYDPSKVSAQETVPGSNIVVPGGSNPPGGGGGGGGAPPGGGGGVTVTPPPPPVTPPSPTPTPIPSPGMSHGKPPLRVPTINSSFGNPPPPPPPPVTPPEGRTQGEPGDRGGKPFKYDTRENIYYPGFGEDPASNLPRSGGEVTGRGGTPTQRTTTPPPTDKPPDETVTSTVDYNFPGLPPVRDPASTLPPVDGGEESGGGEDVGQSQEPPPSSGDDDTGGLPIGPGAGGSVYDNPPVPGPPDIPIPDLPPGIGADPPSGPSWGEGGGGDDFPGSGGGGSGDDDDAEPDIGEMADTSDFDYDKSGNYVGNGSGGYGPGGSNARDGYGNLIPGMGRGGMVTRPTMARIGEAGPEAVVKMKPPQRRQSYEVGERPMTYLRIGERR